jgi:hypothetical protein
MLDRVNSHDPDLGMVTPLSIPRQLPGPYGIPTDHVDNASSHMDQHPSDFVSTHVKLDKLSAVVSNLLEKQRQILQTLNNLPGIMSGDATDDINLGGVSLPVDSMEEMNKLADVLKDKRTRN